MKNASPVWLQCSAKDVRLVPEISALQVDFNAELGLMCTDENDEEKLTKLYGPLRWQGYDKDPGGFKKIMWYGIGKEFDCRVSSTRSVCGKVRADAFYAQALGKRQEGTVFRSWITSMGP